MTTQDSDNVKAIKALEDVEKLLHDVNVMVQRGARWSWQHDGVTYIDVFGFQKMTDSAGKAIDVAAPLFEVYLHNLGKVPPRFKAVFEQADELLNWIGSLEYQCGSEYLLVRALQRLQRVAFGLLDSQEQQRKRPKRETPADDRFSSPELQEVKQEFVKAKLIVDGRWTGTPAEFECFVKLASDMFGVKTKKGKLERKACASFVGFDGNLDSARSSTHNEQRTANANLIKAICKEIHTKYVK